VIITSPPTPSFIEQNTITPESEAVGQSPTHYLSQTTNYKGFPLFAVKQCVLGCVRLRGIVPAAWTGSPRHSVQICPCPISACVMWYVRGTRG